MSELKFEVKQKVGVISADFGDLKSKLAEKMEEYKGKVFTDDSKKEAKEDIAYLRKFRKSVTDRNSEVRRSYLKPYDDFNEYVKDLLVVVDEPINHIDGQLKEFEEKRVREKKDEIKSIYSELVLDELEDYIPLDVIFGAKWSNQGTTIKSIRQEIENAVSKTQQDIATIKAMVSDKVEDALNIYMSNRNLASAMRCIAEYESRKAEILKRQEKENEERVERDRQAERERIRKEERARIAEEERIRYEAKAKAVSSIKEVDKVAAAPLTSKESLTAIYTIVATKEEFVDIEMALTSLGVYFERKEA